MSENQNLLAEQRRALILDEVRRRGGVRVNELTRKLGVSDMTVRRDLDALARLGVLEKVHGGAVPVAEASTHEPGFEAKSGLELTAKEDIARTAATLVAPGTAIALSGGTTTYALAHHLLDVPDLTVVTNSVRVADVFHSAQRSSGQRQGAATVVLTGGVRTPSDSLVGPVADQAIAALGQGTAPRDLPTQGWTTHHWLHFLRNLPKPLDVQKMADLDAASLATLALRGSHFATAPEDRKRSTCIRSSTDRAVSLACRPRPMGASSCHGTSVAA